MWKVMFAWRRSAIQRATFWESGKPFPVDSWQSSEDITMSPLRSSFGLFFPLLFLAAFAVGASPQESGTKERLRNDDLAALIDKLQDVAVGDVGYETTYTGSGFLPL